MHEPKLRIYEFDKFRVDVSKRLLTKGEEQIPLTPKVFDTLLYLIRHSGKVIEKDELMRQIWTDSVVEENNLNQNISILRRVFGEKPGEQRFIVTIAGHGYRFVPEVRQVLTFGSGIADIESTETLSEIDARKTEDQITNDAAQETDVKNPIQNRKLHNRKWLVGFAIFSVFVLGAFGFYLRNSNDKANDTPIKTIAVLPFKPLVLENRNEALELGLADTLISKLSGGEEIVVRPLSAIRRFNSVEQDSSMAAHELGVDSVLDGTIQNWGDRIRISAKLLRTSDGKQLWAGQFDEKFTDIFAVQDVIAEKVAAALKIRLGRNEKKHSTENVEAYQLYMKGRYHLAKGTPPDTRTSISYFQQAIEIDARYARAYLGLSQAYGVLGIFGEVPPVEAFPKARAAEQKALEIDDTLSEAHAARCMGLFWSEWDWHAAEKECLAALEINPNDAESHGYLAIVLSNTGRHIEALAEAKRARELNPLDLGIGALEGYYLLHAGRTDEALIQLKKISELEPNFPMSHSFAASAYIEKGMFDEAIAESRKEYELSARNDLPFGVYALAKSSKRDEASAALKELLRLSATKYVSPYNISLIYNALNERERALEWLEKAYERRDPKMTFLKVEPKWNNLRNEPRFIDLMKRMKLQ